MYAYWNESYRDPITRKPTARRTYMGRVDPETKEIVKKAENGKRNRSPVGEHQNKNAADEGTIQRISDLEQKLKATSLSENEIKEIVPEILKLISLKENVENKQMESSTQNFLLDLRQDITNNSNNVSIDIKNNK